MKFTYESYLTMLKKVKDRGYSFATYQNWKNFEKSVILRHDVDCSLKMAAIFSDYEKKYCNTCKGIYFVLVSTNFYNIHSKESRNYIEMIIKNGGIIGLHFDETQYNIQSEQELKEHVYKEADTLSKIIGTKVNTMSMHKPSAKFLSNNISFENIINTYSQIYFKDMKYLSDSRRNWRENVDELIEQETYQRLHILTHPIWYSGGVEKNLRQSLRENILNASLDYYDNLNNNFRNLSEEITRVEIEEIITC